MSESTELELPTGGKWPKLAVKNFGPIAEGDVELRPLTVLAGPSNVGKSWLATLIYVMIRHANGGYGLRDFRPHIRSGNSDADSNRLAGFPEDPRAWLQSLQEGGTLRLTEGEKRVLKSALESGKDALEAELLRCFSPDDIGNLVCESGARGAATINSMSAVAPGAFAAHQRLKINEKGDFSLCVGIETDEFRPSSGRYFTGILERLQDVLLYDELAQDHSRYLREEILHSLSRDSHHSSVYYLPADRGGVMHAHRVVVGALIQGASRGGLTHRSPLPTLSGVLGDFLEQLIELADHKVRGLSAGDSSTDLARRLEQEVLGGRVDIETNNVDYPHFIYRPDGWKRDLSLMSVSSMVSELAPVALYLRHYVLPGDLLILEEPEAHLHPEMQTRLVREIAGWVRQGIKVLITTHSEWVLDGIANLIAAGEAAKENSLKRAEVGMWLFENNGTQVPGSSIREVEWSVDRGGFSADYDDVARRLHNDWASLVEEVE